LHGILT
jgi:hypothetical protein